MDATSRIFVCVSYIFLFSLLGSHLPVPHLMPLWAFDSLPVGQFSQEHLKHKGVVTRAQPSVFRKQSLAADALISNACPGAHSGKSASAEAAGNVFDSRCCFCSDCSWLPLPDPSPLPSFFLRMLPSVIWRRWSVWFSLLQAFVLFSVLPVSSWLYSSCERWGWL